MKTLTVLYDANCGFCVKCRAWLESQPAYLKLEFLPAQSDEVPRRFPGLARRELPEEITVVANDGGVYRNERAWIMCLYALRDYREWSLRLADPAMLPHVRHVDEFFARRRHALSRFFGWCGEGRIMRELRNTPRCAGGTCREVEFAAHARLCARCGAPLAAGERYCTSCGLRVPFSEAAQRLFDDSDYPTPRR